ncbi:poly [ADP-ribose] polymerase 9-like isoform X2 [Carassius auratus]|nr:poly [ADP-ribose] polymerase 9-like isoform X2 [Carassius auratus]XP_026074003.1 poly [ADP-ribose] polymerase 9-like isoform X2 [Carassius auratus]
MSDKEHNLVPLLTEQAAILEKFGSAFCHAVSVKFKCTAVLHNVKEAGSLGINTSGAWRPEKRYSTKLSSGVEVSVWKDDLTRHNVAAVVNAANENLNHGGGLAQALSNAGGPIIQQWSDQYMQKVKRVKTGDAVLGPAGKLPCKHIIHAVGPKLSQNPSRKDIDYAAPLLFNAINSILQIVLKENIVSVAIPALSSGLFNFPRDLCADIIVKAINQFHLHNAFQDKNLDIHLVNNDEPSVQEMERATRMILGPPSTSGSYSGAVKVRNQSMTSSSSSDLQFGNVTLYLKKGLIQEERADVIVNTIALNRDLSKGEVSKAILKKAGKMIQDEISKMGNSISFSGGDLYITNGYGLGCRSVFHIAMTYMCNQTLYNSVSECLSRATMGYKSISLPAIGTGNLGFRKQDVAQIMMDAVAVFSKQCMDKLDVYFVVFPKDKEMMEAFENEMKRKKGAAKYPEIHNNMTSFTSPAKETIANETPTVEFYSVSNEALREAKVWTFNMLKPSKAKTIKNNHILHFGQEDHEYLLSLQTMLNVHIEEFFKNGNGGITITGNTSDVSCAAIEVENMLCKAQEDFLRAEERDILYSVVRWSCEDVPWIQTPEISAILEKAYLEGKEKRVFSNHKVNLESMTVIDNTGGMSILKRTCLLTRFESINNSYYARTPVSREDHFDKDIKVLESFGHRIVKMEKLENIPLKQLFKMNMQRVKDKPKRLYQRVSAQFCDLICRLGFQKEFAPPAEQRCGSGIYFSTMDEVLKLWNEQEHEQYIYIIQAQVLTGNSTDGSPNLIMPPPLGKDPLDRYDSVNHRKQTYVIFNSQQALPEYLFICAK